MTYTRVTAVAAGAAAVAVLAGGAAYATTTNPAPTAAAAAGTQQAGQQHKHHAQKGLANRAEHGQLSMPGKAGDRLLDLQRGRITGVTPAAAGKPAVVTVTSKDGYRATYTLTATSRVRDGGRTVAIATLKVGERARVVALHTAGTASVLRLAAHTPRAPHTPRTAGTTAPSAAPTS